MADHSRITTLFLDIGGVLLTNGWDRNARALAALHFQLDLDELNERHHLTYDTYEVGKLSLQEYLDRVVFYNSRAFSQADFRNFMFSQSRELPEMIPLIRRLRERNQLRVAAVSNEGRELTEHRIAQFQLGEIIDYFVCSCFVHFRKPDADIYRLALDIAQAQPNEVVYIDDRPMFVDIAQTLGIQGICHQSYCSTRDRIEALELRC